MEKAKQFLESKWITGFIAFLIIFSVFSFSLETLPNLPPGIREFLSYSEVFIVLAFTAEYLIRLFSSQKKFAFVTSFHGMIDLLAILPFYLTLALDLRTLRLIRLLRLLRVLKLARYNAAFTRMRLALTQAKEELIISVIVLSVVIYLAAFGMFQIEHEAQPDKFSSIIDALWWAISTVTTVGYGDVYPITFMGRVFTFVILILSLGLVAIPTGIFASALISVKNKPIQKESDDNLD